MCRYFIAIIFFWCASKAYTQNSRFENFLQKAEQYKIENYLKAYYYADSAITLAKAANDSTMLTRAYNRKGIVEQVNSRYTAAAELFKVAEQYARRPGDARHLAAIYNNMGINFEKEGSLKSCIEMHHKALNIRQKLKEEKDIAASYENLGVAYFSLGDIKKAIENTQKGISISEALKDDKTLGFMYSNLGAMYFQQYNDSLALENYRRSLEKGKNLKNPDILASAYLNISTFYTELGKMKEARRALREAINNPYIFKTERRVALFLNLANCFEKENQSDSATYYYFLALKNADDLKLLSKQAEVYRNLEKFYEKQGDYKKAHTFLDSFHSIKSRILNEKTLKNISELETIYKTERQALEIVALNTENRQEKERRKSRTNLLLVSLICLCLAGTAAIVFYRSVLTKRKDNAMLTEKNTIIARQKELVEQKNTEITDSIKYAYRLQNAILPSKLHMEQLLGEHFVFYKPKDIIAGDFYWLYQNGARTYLAVADSTGHGVPGAMVSIVCSNALDKAVKELQITDPGKILDKTRELIADTFSKSEGEIKDGMDISLLCYNKEEQTVYWSGANNKLLYYQEGSLHECRPDKQPVGLTHQPRPFTTHKILVSGNMMFYLFTDGYADQFGGPQGKKFKQRQLEELLSCAALTPVPEQKELLEKTIQNWMAGIEQIDDMTVIGWKITT